MRRASRMAVTVMCATTCLSVLLGAPAAQAAIKPGKACLHRGQVVWQGGRQYTCIRKGGRLVWSAGTRAPASTTTQGRQSAWFEGPVKQVASTYEPLASTGNTRIADGTQPDGYLNAVGFESTTGLTLLDHPAGLASNGVNLVLVDRGDNRVLIWNRAPQAAGELPDVVLCQPDTTSTRSGAGLDQCNMPTDAVVTPDGKLLLADTDNDRVLVWRSLPTRTGQPADFVLNLKAEAWPWGVWSDGSKVAVTLTRPGELWLWNEFPGSGSEPPSTVITGSGTSCLGTPRELAGNSVALLVGDHNGRCGDPGSAYVFSPLPTSPTASPAYAIVSKGGGQWPTGSVDPITGRLHLTSGMFLAEYPGLTPTPPLATLVATSVAWHTADGGDVQVAGGRTYVSDYNGNRLAAFSGRMTAASMPAFWYGSSGIVKGAKDVITNLPVIDNALQDLFIGDNPQVVTLSGSMAMLGNRAFYVWTRTPKTNGAKPNLVWTTDNQYARDPLLAFTFAPSAAAAGMLNGKPVFAVSGERTVVVWSGVPTKATDVPILNARDTLGSIAIQGGATVAVDDSHFYLLDQGAKRVYVWNDVPGAGEQPVFSFPAEVNRIRSDGTWLVATSLYFAPQVRLYRVASLAQDAQPSGSVTGIPLNLPQDALVAQGTLFVADTNFHRVLGWNDVNAAMNGAPPDAYLGASGPGDIRPESTVGQLRWPGTVWAADGYLWVGEFKFGHRVLRYPLSP